MASPLQPASRKQTIKCLIKCLMGVERGSKTCVIVHCRTNKIDQAKTLLFPFPLDPQMFLFWAAICRKQGQFIDQGAHICIRHFTDSDIVHYSGGYKAIRIDTVPSKEIPIHSNSKSQNLWLLEVFKKFNKQPPVELESNVGNAEIREPQSKILNVESAVKPRSVMPTSFLQIQDNGRRINVSFPEICDFLFEKISVLFSDFSLFERDLRKAESLQPDIVQLTQTALSSENVAFRFYQERIIAFVDLFARFKTDAGSGFEKLLQLLKFVEQLHKLHASSKWDLFLTQFELLRFECDKLCRFFMELHSAADPATMQSCLKTVRVAAEEDIRKSIRVTETLLNSARLHLGLNGLLGTLSSIDMRLQNVQVVLSEEERYLEEKTDQKKQQQQQKRRSRKMEEEMPKEPQPPPRRLLRSDRDSGWRRQEAVSEPEEKRQRTEEESMEKEEKDEEITTVKEEPLDWGANEEPEAEGIYDMIEFEIVKEEFGTSDE